MSVKVMEGFETVGNTTDMVSRGLGTNIPVGTIPARYAGGKALVRTNAAVGSVVMSAPTNIADGAGYAVSMMARLTKGNTTNFPTLITYANGQYLAGSTATAQSRISVAVEPGRWGEQQVISPSTTYYIYCVLYDVGRNQYTAFGSTGATGGPTAVYTSPTLSSTNWTLSVINNGVSGTFTNDCRGYYDTDANNIILVCYNQLAYRRPQDSDYTIVDRSASRRFTCAVKTSTQWLVFGDVAAYYVSPTGSSWTSVNSTNVAGTYSAAFGNNTVVIGKSNSLAYSTDNGVTFTNATLPVSLAGVVHVAFIDGKFVAFGASSANTSYVTSTDGITWTARQNPSTGLTASNISVANNVCFVSLAPTNLMYSTDGINWTFTEMGFISPTIGASVMGFTYPYYSNSYMGFCAAGTPTADTYTAYTLSLAGMGSTATATAVSTPMNRDQWYNFETIVTKNSDTSYTQTFNVDGVPVYSRELPWTVMSSVQRLAATPAVGSGATNNKGTVVLPSATASQVQVSTNNGFSFSAIAAPSAGTIYSVLWTGSQFVACGSARFCTSPDGLTWTTLSYAPTGQPYDAAMNGNVIIAACGNAGIIARSTDGGNTWSTITGIGTTGFYSVGYINGTWVLGATTGTTLQYSNDNGVTWLPVTSPAPVYYLGHANHKGALYFTSQTSVLKITANAGAAPTIVSQGVTTNFYNIASNGEYLLGSNNSATTQYYSADGANWLTASAPVGNSYTTAVGKSFIRYGNTSSNGTTTVFPHLTDMPINAYMGASNFSSLDDVVVTDFVAPNVGPQGEVQIRLMPSDTDVQKQWSPIPEDSPTNAAAATKLPLSASSGTYVESNEAGQKDIYGTSSFSYPNGLRPLAVQIEGNFERVYTNTPQVQLGLINNGAEVSTSVVNVSSALGSSTYVSKTLEANPDGNVSWTREALNSTQLSVTKVS